MHTEAVKSDLLAVRGPARASFHAWVLCELPHVAAIGVHDEEVGRTRTKRAEGDALAVWGPSRLHVAGFVVSDGGGIAAVGVDGVDVEVAVALGREGYPAGWFALELLAAAGRKHGQQNEGDRGEGQSAPVSSGG